MDWITSVLEGGSNLAGNFVSFFVKIFGNITHLVYLAPADVATGGAFEGMTSGVQPLGIALIAGAVLGVIGGGVALIKGLFKRHI